MASQLLQQPFFQVTLPILVTMVATVWAASWSQSKRLDDIVRRLDAIEARLGSLVERITRLEERMSPLARSK